MKLKPWLVAQLRRVHQKWGPKSEVFKAARVARGRYKCNMCEETVHYSEIRIDHIEPVVSLDGFRNWDEYIDRMFCDASGYQALCNTCHDEKTLKENKQRRGCGK
jgi:hypothetical protein